MATSSAVKGIGLLTDFVWLEPTGLEDDARARRNWEQSSGSGGCGSCHVEDISVGVSTAKRKCFEETAFTRSWSQRMVSVREITSRRW